MKVAYLILAVFLVSCGEPEQFRTISREEVVCSNATRDQRANFILTCLKNANPHSDEEPEDWIGKCQTMAEETLCGKRFVKVNQHKAATGFMEHSYWKDVSIDGEFK